MSNIVPGMLYIIESHNMLAELIPGDTIKVQFYTFNRSRFTFQIYLDPIPAEQVLLTFNPETKKWSIQNSIELVPYMQEKRQAC